MGAGCGRGHARGRNLAEKSLIPRSDHFRSNLSDPEARTLFKDSVSQVEIELFTFCNRKCWFCPNAVMPERQDREGPRMKPELYDRILADLKSAGYAGAITFSRYNEPLALKEVILEAARKARAACPDSFIFTHTNGDYLTRAYLDELRDAGFNCVRVQSYLGNNEKWDRAKMLERQERQAWAIGLPYIVLSDTAERRMVDIMYPKMDVTLDARDFDRIGVDRGGLVDVALKGQRMARCEIPFTNMYIDFNGCVMPCCNLRSDRAEHQKYIVSDLSGGASLFDAYRALAGWRKDLNDYGPKRAPCNTCSYEALDVALPKVSHA